MRLLSPLLGTTAVQIGALYLYQPHYEGTSTYLHYPTYLPYPIDKALPNDAPGFQSLTEF